MWNRLQDSKGFFIFLSITVAIVCWFYVDLRIAPNINVKIRNIPVTYEGLEELEAQGLMLEDGADATVTLKVTGQRSVISQLNRNNIEVTVDAGKQITAPGTQRLEYTVTFPSSVSNSGISISSRSVSAIDVTVIKSTTRSVNVTGVFTGSVEDGYVAGDFELEHRYINISGDETLVDEVDHAAVTLSRTGLRSDWSGILPITLENKAGEPIDNDKLSLSHDEVYVTMTVRRVRDVKLTVDIKDGGGATAEDVTFTINPEQIKVSGSEEVLADLKEYNLGTIDLSQVITSEEQTFQLNLPSGVTCESGEETATVNIKLPNLTTVKLETNHIQLLNVPEDKQVTVQNQSLEVRVRGDKKALDLLVSDDISVQVDLDELDDNAYGTYSLPATVTLKGFSEIGVVGTYEVQVYVD